MSLSKTTPINESSFFLTDDFGYAIAPVSPCIGTLGRVLFWEFIVLLDLIGPDNPDPPPKIDEMPELIDPLVLELLVG